MPKHARGLGSGLNELIPPKKEEEKEHAGQELMVPIGKVEPDRDQFRKNFNEDALLELAESIKQHGIFQPILVEKKDNYYKIIAGERRWRAAKMAGLKEVPVLEKNFSEQEKAEIQLIENIQREDLNPIEVAEGYKKLIDSFNLTQDELAEKVSKSRTQITNTMRLLKLDQRVRQMIIDDMISAGHGRAILAIEDPDRQYEFAQRVFDEKLTVRETEKEIKKLQKEKKEKEHPKKPVDEKTEAIYHDLEERLKGKTGTKVTIIPKDQSHGRVEIEYYSQTDLDRIAEILSSGRAQ